ncbi:MAG: hypothetical protein KDA05_03600, partial [Phycisphaerales bacterium]|nr:hypothetical protein [Phycisphaerales bacterium]
MDRIDLGKQTQILELNDLLRRGSKIREPASLIAHYGNWIRKQRPLDHLISISRRGLADGQYKVTRSIRMVPGTLSRMSAANPWRDWDSIPIRSGGFIGMVLEREGPQVFRNLHIENDPVLGDSVADMRACVAIPNYDNGESLNWGLWFAADPDAWTFELVESGLLTANLLGLATSNLVAHKRAAELNTRLETQLVQIANIQRSLLPQRLPVIPGLRLAASYLTSD